MRLRRDEDCGPGRASIFGRCGRRVRWAVLLQRQFRQVRLKHLVLDRIRATSRSEEVIGEMIDDNSHEPNVAWSSSAWPSMYSDLSPSQCDVHGSLLFIWFILVCILLYQESLVGVWWTLKSDRMRLVVIVSPSTRHLREIGRRECINEKSHRV